MRDLMQQRRRLPQSRIHESNRLSWEQLNINKGRLCLFRYVYRAVEVSRRTLVRVVSGNSGEENVDLPAAGLRLS
jgi:hypothetical protein